MNAVYLIAIKRCALVFLLTYAFSWLFGENAFNASDWLTPFGWHIVRHGGVTVVSRATNSVNTNNMEEDGISPSQATVKYSVVPHIMSNHSLRLLSTSATPMGEYFNPYLSSESSRENQEKIEGKRSKRKLMKGKIKKVFTRESVSIGEKPQHQHQRGSGVHKFRRWLNKDLPATSQVASSITSKIEDTLKEIEEMCRKTSSIYLEDSNDSIAKVYTRSTTNKEVSDYLTVEDHTSLDIDFSEIIRQNVSSKCGSKKEYNKENITSEILQMEIESSFENEFDTVRYTPVGSNKFNKSYLMEHSSPISTKFKQNLNGNRDSWGPLNTHELNK